jgi:energy-coupling factor transport system ATP-binding protein
VPATRYEFIRAWFTAAPSVVLLDEPTRGLDYAAKEQLRAILRRLAGDGAAVVVATHDVEFVATTCDRTVVLAQGEIVAEGATAAVVCASPMLAPQVAKVLAPEPWLDVDTVIEAAREAVTETVTETVSETAIETVIDAAGDRT